MNFNFTTGEGISAAVFGIVFMGALLKAFWDAVTRGSTQIEYDQMIAEEHEKLEQAEERTTDEHHDIVWSELDPVLRHKAVLHMRSLLTVEDARAIQTQYEADPLLWWAPYHFFAGMAIRNELRQHVATDDQLPTRNWDDYWVRTVEAAVGVKPV